MDDFSFGVIPLRQRRKTWEVLLIQHQAGHWSFPKGHADPGESPQTAAERELEEETGLKVVRYLSERVLKETYFFTDKKKKIHKTVSYYIALVEGDVTIQEAEIKDCRWVPLKAAEAMITFPEGKRICREVILEQRNW